MDTDTFSQSLKTGKLISSASLSRFINFPDKGYSGTVVPTLCIIFGSAVEASLSEVRQALRYGVPKAPRDPAATYRNSRFPGTSKHCREKPEV